ASPHRGGGRSRPASPGRREAVSRLPRRAGTGAGPVPAGPLLDGAICPGGAGGAAAAGLAGSGSVGEPVRERPRPLVLTHQVHERVVEAANSLVASVHRPARGIQRRAFVGRSLLSRTH